MVFTRRKFRGNLKSLLHFDYPYYLESGDGCRDEIGLTTWTRQGSTKFVGTEIPNDAIVDDTPKFGYRCAQFATVTDYLKGTNTAGIWNLSSEGNYEVEMFVRPTSTESGSIFSLRDGVSDLLLLAKDGANRLTITSVALGLNKTSTATLNQNAFSHVLLRFSGGTARVFLNGAEVLNQTMTSGVTLIPIEIRLGGFAGQMDEFAFRHTARSSAPTVPNQPYQGVVDIHALGGAGNGSHGDITITASNPTIINTYATVNSVTGDDALSVTTRAKGLFGDFSVGDEVLLHISSKKNRMSTEESLLGLYAFRRIVRVVHDVNDIIVLDKAIKEEFFLSSEVLSKYNVQMISVPNFKSLVIEKNAIITAPSYLDGSARGGGIVVFKCQDNCVVREWGSIKMNTTYQIREDRLQMTHAQLLDRFLVGYSGGVLMIIGGTLEATGRARIGGSHDGSLRGGTGGVSLGGDTPYTVPPSPGGAGYGGGGSSASRCRATGGKGGVGGGGGGAGNVFAADCQFFGGDAGKPGKVSSSNGGRYKGGEAGTGGGGAGAGQKDPQHLNGGIAGIDLQNIKKEVMGGSGPGGGESGVCVLCLARKLKVSAASMCTGGNACQAVGGGGTGFCFIAAKEME